MSLRPPRSERGGRLCGWLIPAAGLVLAPKCALCLLAYAGFGTALGLGGPEFCGFTPEPAMPWLWLLPVIGAALAIVTLRRRRA